MRKITRLKTKLRLAPLSKEREKSLLRNMIVGNKEMLSIKKKSQISEANKIKTIITAIA